MYTKAVVFAEGTNAPNGESILNMHVNGFEKQFYGYAAAVWCHDAFCSCICAGRGRNSYC